MDEIEQIEKLILTHKGRYFHSESIRKESKEVMLQKIMDICMNSLNQDNGKPLGQI